MSSTSSSPIQLDTQSSPSIAPKRQRCNDDDDNNNEKGEDEISDNDGDKEKSKATKRLKKATKRLKSSAIADDLICPISMELPIDPVTAEDGRVYDRSAIETYFEGKDEDEIVSPLTRAKMGTRLLPAVQHKNLIQSLIDGGMITGTLAIGWNEKLSERKEMDELVKDAEKGDKESMYVLALCYLTGKRGFQKDGKLAFDWSRKVHAAGYPPGTGVLGSCYVFGFGMDKASKAEGLHYLTMAATLGCDNSAFTLALFRSGTDPGCNLLQADRKEEIFWLEKALDPKGPYQNLGEEAREEARDRLRELKID